MHSGRSIRRWGTSWCGWVAVIATFSGFKVVTVNMINPQSQREPSSTLRDLHRFRTESASPEIAARCSEDLHRLIDQQELDWSQKRSLPDFLVRDDEIKGGGVIVFWHLAKTGGTSVRKQCASLPGVDYLLLLSPDDYYSGSKLISDRLTPSSKIEELDAFNHSHRHTLFVELHGVLSPPTVLDMESQMQHWRSLSRQHGTALFVFTILREPTSFSLSFYNFFHKGMHGTPSQRDLPRRSFNRQCHTLASPGHNKHICATLYNRLYHLFDWVGITERLTEETLPLLQHLLRFKQAQQKFAAVNEESFVLPTNLSRSHYNVAVFGNATLYRDELSPETLQKLKDKTCLDRALWERVQRDYTLEMFTDSINGRPSGDGD
jgi:hypothetical protein